MKWLAYAAAACMAAGAAFAQSDEGDRMTASTFKGFELRNVGPAFMSGRIADIAIDPNDPATWYVGVASGGVWKTTNRGTTWTPVFDDQSVYAIGTVALDPSNANVVWVGTGENNGGRHISFGDGVYRSKDGGKSWTNLGLKGSEHISEIIVHPNDPDTVWVASQGPLWSAGGERGLYKTTDGGKTWRNTLSAGDYTGVTALLMDPRDPDRLYAATWQHQRTVATYIGAGPETALYASSDGGETWEKLTQGLPTGNLGKIGMAISPINPDVLYAAIELEEREGGVWRSEDRGASWTKMSDQVSGGTGPHYYQELYVHPHIFDRIYLASNLSQVSEDGGRTWRVLRQNHKHVDDHAMAFHPTDPDYILVGSDGGLYESWDDETSWRYIANLPITQFYKVAADDAEPFYFIYGGTQDNSTQGAPSRTDNRHGIRNSDWFLTVFADGHQPAVEWGNPDVMYSQWQQGNLVRHDRITGENLHIQPQAAPGEPAERFNWDAPILVSAHDPKRIYHASQRLWRSDDRGDNWTAISGDLTRNQDRMKLPVMGRQWSQEAGWDLLAMSNYNTIANVAESPINEDLLYVGTDDGLIQVTENGGQSWRKIEVSKLPGVPGTAYVNDIRADLHDEDTVYVALDNHKYGDYKPYLVKSTNRGKSWKSISGDLPETNLVWRITQDHERPELMFLGTEFGLYFTLNGGKNWIEFTSGMPTISIRDVIIQRRENDLVAGSFGRGIYILDDYSPLRAVTEDALEEEAHLFAGRDAWWYMEQHPMGFSGQAEQGHALYRAPNPPFGAYFTYYLRDDYLSSGDRRRKAEAAKVKAGEDTPFPGFAAIEAEREEPAPEVWLVVRDAEGNVVRRLPGATKKGFHRTNWNLRYPATGTARAGESADEDGSFLAPPGEYSVSLVVRAGGETRTLVEPQAFTVKPLTKGALEGAPIQEVVAFWEEIATLSRSVQAASSTISALETRMSALKASINRSRTNPDALDDQWVALRRELHALDEALSGLDADNGYGANPSSIASRIGLVAFGVSNSTYGPTGTHKQQMGYAREGFTALLARLNTFKDTSLPAFEAEVAAAGAPWTPGAAIPSP